MNIIRLNLSRLLFFVMILLLCRNTYAVNVWAESYVTIESPFIKQMLVYSVRVISSSPVNIKKVATPVPQNAVVENIDGPRTYNQTRKNQNYYVTEYRFTVTPLVAGDVQIPASEIHVYYKDMVQLQNQQWNYYNQWQQQSPQVSQTKSKILKSNVINLKVKPQATQNTTWMPLYSFKLYGTLAKNQDYREGEPLKYTVTMIAAGMSGDDLPNLSSQLKSKNFKIYFETAKTEKILSEDHKIITGRRIEQYTLVPRKAGDLTMPEIKYAWWNLLKNQTQWAAVSSQNILVQPAIGMETTQTTLEDLPHFNHALRYFMVMCAAMIIFSLGVWIGAERPGLIAMNSQRGKMQLFFLRRFRAVLLPVRRQIRKGKKWLKYILGYQDQQASTILSRLLDYYDDKLPARLRALRFINRINRARDIDEISLLVTMFANKCLDMPNNSPHSSIANTLCLDYPQFDKQIIQKLFNQLDEIIYSQQTKDLVQWKREFNRLLKYLPLHQSCHRDDKRLKGLQSLNPNLFNRD